jgi:hypothetical protein
LDWPAYSSGVGALRRAGRSEPRPNRTSTFAGTKFNI